MTKVSVFADVKRKSSKAIQEALQYGTVSVSVEADQPLFMDYESGIIPYSCKGKRLDHAILAVGYGEENGKTYLICKNSWGTDWGEKGYAKMEIFNGQGACGVLEDPIIPFVEDDAF